jgi:hypothetical protein
MSASTRGLRNDGETFFSSTQVPFPELSADGKLDTAEFLEAARGVVILVGKCCTFVQIIFVQIMHILLCTSYVCQQKPLCVP